MDLLFSAIAQALPIALAALGGVVCERAGVVNFALEGMMLSGAFAAVWASHASGSPLAGLAAAAAAGAFIALLHAFVSLSLRVNQIVSAIAANLLALGLTGVLLWRVFGQGTSPNVPSLPSIAIGGLAMSPFVPAVLLLAALVWAFLKFTVAGLHLRAVGEDVEAARAAGINVMRVKVASVIFSGVLAGAAGAYLSIGFLSSFTYAMTNGRGYVAIAAVICGKWNPVGAVLAAGLFGLFAATGETLGLSSYLPREFFQALPYLLTLAVLAAFVGRSRPPAALGRLPEPA